MFSFNRLVQYDDLQNIFNHLVFWFHSLNAVHKFYGKRCTEHFSVSNRQCVYLVSYEN